MTERPTLLRPVATRLVRPEWASRVVSPAYDSVRPEYRRELMDADPYVFLHVTRSPGDTVDPDTGQPVESAEEVTEANAAALERLLAEGVFSDIAPSGLYLYRLRKGEHVQTAIIGDVDLRGLDDGRIGPHERIRPQRATLLADHIERVGVHSSPVAFTYADDPAIDAIVERVVAGVPLLDFARDDGLGQTIWRVPDADVATIVERFADEYLYIVDGHHRVSAGVEHWRRSGEAPDAAVVLGALFPASQLRVSSFHRRVSDTGDMTPSQLLDAVAAADFGVRPLDPGEDPEPNRAGTYGMYLDGHWYEISPFHRHPAEFDATLLQERILGPVLGVDEAGGSGRLEYLPGDGGLAQLVALTDAHGGVGFALYPVSLEELMAVVDRGQTLPPKSTYFEPKVRSGVFLTPGESSQAGSLRPMTVIEVAGLEKRYGDTRAVDGVSFSIEAGEVFALLGPNGAGKSTTIEICEGHRERSAGSVSVLGLDPAIAGRELRDRIGIVLQSTGIERELGVREALELYRSVYRRPRSADEVLDMVGLADKADDRVKTLSGGQQRRIDLALGIIGSPELLFLDEPTTGFDPSARRKAWDLIAGLRTGGTTIVLTTHYMEEAQYLADRVAVIVAGRIVAQGTPDQLIDGTADTRIRFRLPQGSAVPERFAATVTARTAEGITELATSTPTELLAELCGWAIAEGFELADLEVVRPSLEDVYLSLSEPVDGVGPRRSDER